VGGRTASGKTFFMVPYHRRVVCGTWESTLPISPDADGTPPHEVLAALVAAGASVDRFEPLLAPMEDIFVRVVKEGRA